jgi:hypothetical protein
MRAQSYTTQGPQGRGQLRDHAPCSEFTAVRRSPFDHREPSILLWDGDKSGETFWYVFGALTRGEDGQVGQNTPRVHRNQAASGRRVKWKERSSRPSRSAWCGPCQTVATWRSKPHRRGKALSRGKATPRVHRSWAASGRRVKWNKRSSRPSRTAWCGPCQAAATWRRKEVNPIGGEKTSREAKKLPECTAVGRPLGGE